MKPSERYRQIKADVPNRYIGIKEPYLTERALLDLLDELHPEAPKLPVCDVCGKSGASDTNVGPRCALHLPGPPPLPPLPQPK